jgi:hypothetical protein
VWFDHAVVVVRDQMSNVAPRFEGQGFMLSEEATHNVGSHNRLIVLSDTYVELLGWPPGTPAPRAEIAASAVGFDAIVFRTDDAEATHQRLREGGFVVSPVTELTRPAMVDGGRAQARFTTVRFAEQPIRGIRVYFCQHLTPELVWQPRLMAHDNGVTVLRRVQAQAPDPSTVADLLRQMAGGARRHARHHEVVLANTTIQVASAPARSEARLVGVTLGTDDGSEVELDLTAASLA